MDNITINKIRFSLEGSKKLVRIYDFNIDPIAPDLFSERSVDSHKVWFRFEKFKFSFNASSFLMYGSAELKFIQGTMNILSRVIMLEEEFVEMCKNRNVGNKPVKVNVYCFTQKEFNDLMAEEVVDNL